MKSNGHGALVPAKTVDELVAFLPQIRDRANIHREDGIELENR